MMKFNGRGVKQTIVAVLTVGSIGLVGADTASAAHIHSMQTGNGSCVLLAQNGGEKDVTLPHTDGGSKSHPLHVNVHLGTPGADGHITIGVQGKISDPCPGDYLND